MCNNLNKMSIKKRNREEVSESKNVLENTTPVKQNCNSPALENNTETSKCDSEKKHKKKRKHIEDVYSSCNAIENDIKKVKKRKSNTIEASGDQEYHDENVSTVDSKIVAEKKKKRRSSVVVENHDENVPSEKEENSKIVAGRKKIRKRKSNVVEESGDNANQDENMSSTSTTAPKFSVPNFRKGLNSEEGIEHVKQFVHQCDTNKSQDIGLEYLNAGGNLLEILHLLDTADKKKISTCTPIFEAVTLLLLKIQSNAVHLASSACEGCRYLLNNHTIIIHSMISPLATAKQKRVALKLLTAIVTLSPLLAKEILLQVTLTESILDNLTQQADGNSSTSVRTAFIHFLLSFLIDGNSANIRNLLEKKGVVGSIFPELIYDDCELVTLVLTTLRNHVLENSNVTKTSKLHTFSTPVLKHIVNLYNWKGRKFWKVKIRKKTDELVDANEKEIVSVAVHNFLLTLCTSRKHGVIFHDKTYGLSGKRCNNLIYTIIQCLDKPWEHKYASELVIKISSACPDLYSYIISSVDNYLEPRASIKWFNVIIFVKGIITSIGSNLVAEDLKEFNHKQLLQLTQNLCTPHVVLKTYSQTRFITHGDPFIREISIDFLITLLKNLNGFIDFIEVHNIVSDLKIFKSTLLDNLIKVLPPISDIVATWSIPVNKQVYTESANIFGQYLNDFNIKIGIIEILGYYYKIFPRSLEEVQNVFKPDKLLVDKSDNELILKATDLFLTLDANAFSPDKEYFIDYLNILLENINASSMQVLQKILINTEIFQNNLLEIYAWLEPIQYQNGRNLLGIALKQAYKNLIEYVEQITVIKNQIGLESRVHTEVDDIFDIIQYVDVSKNKTYSMKHTIVSPLLVSVLDLLKKGEYSLSKDEKEYLGTVLITIFHAQTLPGVLTTLLAQYNKKNFKHVQKYINSWNQSELPSPPPENDHLTLINYLGQYLLSPQATDINLTFDAIEDSDLLKVQVSGKEFLLNAKLKAQFNLHIFEMCIFYFTQLVDKKLIAQERVDQYVTVLTLIFEILLKLQKTDVEILLKIFYNNPFLRQYFLPFSCRKNSSTKLTNEFVLKFTNYLVENSYKIDTILTPFHEKFVTSLLVASKKSRKYLSLEKIEIFNNLTNIFQLTNDESLNIIQAFILLPVDAFVSVENTPSPSVFLNCLLYCLRRNIDIQQIAVDCCLSSAQFQSVIDLYVGVNQLGIEMDTFTETLYAYLVKYPHLLEHLSLDFFETLVGKSIISKADSTLITFMVESNPIMADYAVQNFDKLLKTKEIVFPLVVAKEFDSNSLNSLYKEYEHLIIKTIEKPHKVGVFIRENSKAIGQLISECMPVEKCEEIAGKVNKYEIVEEFHLNILEIIYTKCIKLDGINNVIINNYLQTLIILSINSFKRDDIHKIKILLVKIQKFLYKYKKLSYDLNTVHTNSTWLAFVKFCLKHGIKRDVTSTQIILLETLRLLFEKMYTEDVKDDAKLKVTETVYEMIQLHSEFLDMILSNNSKQKTELLRLIFIVSKFNNNCLSDKLITIFLGAYGATTNKSDQLILSILYLYEKSNISLDKFRPFIWGESAITHYSVRHNVENALWRQPRVGQVLDLIQSEIVHNTIMNFDFKRSFKSLDECSENRNELESGLMNDYRDKYTEMRSHRKHLLRVGDGTVQVYDLNFFIPLFSQLLSSESIVKCYKFTQQGCLALTLLSLASECPIVRQAGYTVLSRFYFHLESKINARDSKLWIEFINRIRCGLIKVHDEKDAGEQSSIRIPVISAVFLARAAIIMTQPLNPLYVAVNNFLFVKEAIDFTIVPELLQMFHSPEIEYNIHRNWILQVIRDGFKCKLDYQIMHKSVGFKMLLDFYSCTFANYEAKCLILQVIEKCTNLPGVTKYLLFDAGLLSWLNNVSYNLQKSDVQQINILARIVNNLSLLINNFENNSEHILQEQLLYIVITLATLFTSKMSLDTYVIFTRLLCGLAKNNYHRITKDQVVKIIHFSNVMLGNNHECNYLLLFGCKYVTKHAILTPVDNDQALAKYYLKQFTIGWIEGNRDLIDL